MKEQELIDWFNNYFYNCYYVKHDDFPESIFMFYDINYVRQLKLAKLEGKKYVEKTDITGVCLFQQDWKYKWFCCNYDYIWLYLRDKYSFSYDDFKSFIRDMLEEHTKMSVLTPDTPLQAVAPELEEHTKMSVLTPNQFHNIYPRLLEEHTKMSVLTPDSFGWSIALELEEHSKMSVLTPTNVLKEKTRQLEEHSKMNILTPSANGVLVTIPRI